MSEKTALTRCGRSLAVNAANRPLMSIVRQERLLWTSLGLITGAVSFIDIRVRPRAPVAGARATRLIPRLRNFHPSPSGSDEPRSESTRDADLAAPTPPSIRSAPSGAPRRR